MRESEEQESFRAWLQEHGPRFLLYARQKARTEADAQDLLQEALVEACRKQMGGATPEPPLVYATIRRRAIDWARRDTRRVAREQESSPAADCWFDTSPEDKELAQWAQQALAKLPEPQREVLALKLWSGLTFAEISEALGIPANTAASRYRYALEELRKISREVLT